MLGRIFPVVLMSRAMYSLSPDSEKLPTSKIVNSALLSLLAFIISLRTADYVTAIIAVDCMYVAYKYGFPSLSSEVSIPGGGWFD